MSQKIMFVMMFFVLFVTVYGIWDEETRDEAETDQQDRFYGDVRQFMGAGGRNTAIQGHELCERITRIERSDVDCDEIYFKKSETP